MAAARAQRSLASLAKELLFTRAVTITTTRDGGVASVGSELDAVTVIQLDGEVINYFRAGASLDRHFAELRRVRALLKYGAACWRGSERGVFWTGTLGAQYFAHSWLWEALLNGGFAALSAQSGALLRSALGLATPFALYGIREFGRRALLRAAENAFPEVLSGRAPRPV
ncbi:MAG: hypothetical protein ACOY0T_11860 [Myxococcota bacterium]